MATVKYTGRTFVSMTPELQQDIRDLANEKQMTQATLIRQALLEYIRRNKA